MYETALLLGLLLGSSFSSFADGQRTIASCEAEIRFLRAQLALFLSRRTKPRRPDAAVRLQLTLLSFLFDWRSALVVVRPETLIRWQRKVSALDWAWISKVFHPRERTGRPTRKGAAGASASANASRRIAVTIFTLWSLDRIIGDGGQDDEDRARQKLELDEPLEGVEDRQRLRRWRSRGVLPEEAGVRSLQQSARRLERTRLKSERLTFDSNAAIDWPGSDNRRRGRERPNFVRGR
ncbi:MAG TPA: hypothetical protein VMT00_04475 [Thermoanaerobaculia bacterium]|nr:hypothetical protein [Thermoanaerobaculia bacterium]